MRKYDIISNDTFLDTYEDFSISLNYSIDDITDITSRSNPFSKTIKLPGTRVNNKFFKHLFDADVENLDFNPLKKIPSVIKVNDLSVLEGSMQLLNIIVNDNSVEYEVTVNGSLNDIITTIGNYNLKDLDLSEYNHVRDRTNIEKSWSYINKVNGNDYDFNQGGNGYVYPYIINGNSSNIINTTYIYDMYPAIYAREYINKIFDFAGYSYTSKFIDSDYFRKLIIPFNLEGIQLSDEVVSGRTTVVGPTYYPDDDDWVSITTGVLHAGDPWYYNSDYNYDFPLLVESGTRGDITFQDPNGEWQQYGGWTCANQGWYDINLHIPLFAKYISDVLLIAWDGEGTFKYDYKLVHKKSDGSTTILDASANPVEFAPSDNASHFTPWVDTANQLEFDLSATNVFIAEGEQILISFAFRYPEYKMKWDDPSVAATPSVNLQMVMSADYLGDVGYFKIAPSTTYDMGNQEIDMTNVLLDMKMDTFLLNIIKMFNMVIIDNPDKPNDLIIEPRELYYKSKTKVLDWTEKIDENVDIQYTPMSEVDFTKYIFKYSDDDDYYNKQYTTETKRIYGDLEYDIYNDFSNQDTTLELDFSPTPSASIGIADRVAPFFVDMEDSTFVPRKVNPRILFYEGLKDIPNADYGYWILSDSPDSGNATSFNKYPYAGMWNDPINPIYDLGFSPTSKIYFQSDNVPFQNLFQMFHKTTFYNIVDINAKLLDGYFHLTEKDISELDYRDIIKIGNQHYRINAINDYDPVTYDTTNVILYKIINGNEYVPDNGETPTSNMSCPIDVRVVYSEKLGVRILNSPSGEVITKDCCDSIGGVWNGSTCQLTYATGSGSVDGETPGGLAGMITRNTFDLFPIKTYGPVSLLKNNNSINSVDVKVYGTGNYVKENTQSSLIVGNNNSIIGGTSQMIIGDGIFADPTVKGLYTDNIVISSGGTLNGMSISQITNEPFNLRVTGTSSYLIHEYTFDDENLYRVKIDWLAKNVTTGTTKYYLCTKLVDFKTNISGTTSYLNETIINEYSDFSGHGSLAGYGFSGQKFQIYGAGVSAQTIDYGVSVSFNKLY